MFHSRFMQSINRKSPYPAISFAGGRVDPILISHRFQKVPVFIVHTEKRKRQFQKIPLWRIFSESCVFGDCFHRIRMAMDGRRIRKEKVAFSNENGYVWTGSKLNKKALRPCIFGLLRFFKNGTKGTAYLMASCKRCCKLFAECSFFFS